MRIAALLMPAMAAAAAMAASPGLPGAGDERVVATSPPAARAWQPHVTVRLQTKAADIGALRLQQRATGRHGPWEVSMLSERDPGEARWHDHIVGYVQRTTARLDLAAGSLRPAVGQGLLFGRGGSTGVPTPAPRRDGARLGYRSSSEARTIDGVVARWRGVAWTAALLAGALRWDARLNDAAVAVSLLDDGDHSGSGASTRGRLRGRIVAGRWTARAGRTDLGISVQHLRFASPVDLRRQSTPYAFHGQRQSSLAADVVRRRGGRLRWYGAVARGADTSAALAGVSGLVAAGLRVNLLGRWYGAGFFAPLGGAASGADMNNEHGMTLQIRGRGWRSWVDVTQRPSPRVRQPLSTARRAAGVHGETRRGSWQWSADLQQQVSSLWLGDRPGQGTTTRARMQGRQSRGLIRLTLRADGVRYRRVSHGVPTEGLHGLSGSLAVRWRRPRVRMDGLVSLFHTGGYAARIYEYEPQVPGALSIRPLYGRGVRVVAVCGVHLGHLQVNARWRLYAVATGVQHVAALQIEMSRRSR